MYVSKFKKKIGNFVFIVKIRFCQKQSSFLIAKYDSEEGGYLLLDLRKYSLT